MTVRTRVEKLEKVMPGGQQIVVLFPGGADDEQCVDEYCAEHGVSRDDHRFLCVTFVAAQARGEESSALCRHSHQVNFASGARGRDSGPPPWLTYRCHRVGSA